MMLITHSKPFDQFEFVFGDCGYSPLRYLFANYLFEYSPFSVKCDKITDVRSDLPQRTVLVDSCQCHSGCLAGIWSYKYSVPTLSGLLLNNYICIPLVPGEPSNFQYCYQFVLLSSVASGPRGMNSIQYLILFLKNAWWQSKDITAFQN